MPGVNVTVSLSEVLEVRGAALTDAEIWALLCQGAETLQDLFIREQVSNEFGPAFVINPDSLYLNAHGHVEFGRAQRVQQYANYMAPETEEGFVMTPTAVEQIFVYALGKSLVYSSEYGLRTEEPLNISQHLESLLSQLTNRNPADRMALVSVMEACDLQKQRHLREKRSTSQTLIDLYRTVLGIDGHEDAIHDPVPANKPTNHRPAPEVTADRSRRKHKRSRNSGRRKHRSTEQKYRSRSRSSSYSRSRSHSKRRGKRRGGDSPDSGYQRTTPLLSARTGYDENGRKLPRTDHVRESRPDLKAADGTTGRSYHLSDISFTSSHNGSHSQSLSAGPQPPSRHSRPANRGLQAASNTRPRLTDRADNPAFKKYLKLKERQRKLRALRAGMIDEDASDELSDMVVEHIAETQSVQSYVPYNQGVYQPDVHVMYGSNSALRLGRDSDRDSIMSSDASLYGTDRHALRANGDISDPYIQQLQQMTAAPPLPPTLAPQPPPRKRRQHKQPSPRATQKPRDYYGPEFVHRATKPIHRIPVLLQGESRKNPARVCRVVVVLLNGQKLEVMCDPSTTGQQLFEAVVTEIELPEFYFFGLTYVSDNEHFFITADQKLHKVAPSGWRESWKSPGANVTFTVHLRVKFYVDNVAALKHETTRHQLYLQLRRDILEGRCQCPEDKALALAGLALQAEYGDYSPATLGRDYLVPEHYYPGAVERQLGAAYILDNTPAAHRDGAGLSEVEAELEFIKLVQEQLPEYGVHFHKLLKRKKDTSDTIWVGVNVNQLVLAETSGHDRVIVHRHTWPSIMKISFNRRRFSVQPRPDVGQLKPTKLNFYTTSYRKGQYLLKFCTVQHSFQLKMKSRLAGHDTIPGIEGVEGTSIGGIEDMDSSGTDNEGTVVDDQDSVESQSGRFPATDHIPQKQAAAYRNPPPYRPDASASMIELPHMNHDEYRVPYPRAATVDNIPDISVEPADIRPVEVVPNQAYVIDMSTNSMDKTLCSPSGNETISDTLHQRFRDDLLSPEATSRDQEVFEVTLQKHDRHGIGVTIVGGETGGKLDLGIFVKSVTVDGPAYIDGRIKPGDRIIAINDTTLEGFQHHEAVKLIKKSTNSVTLLISQIRAPKSIRKRDYDDANFQLKLRGSCLDSSSDSDSENSASHNADGHSYPVITVHECIDVNSHDENGKTNNKIEYKANENDLYNDSDNRDVAGSMEGTCGATGEGRDSTTADVQSTLSQVDSLHSEMAVSQLPTDDQTDMHDDSSAEDSDFDSAIQAVISGQAVRQLSAVAPGGEYQNGCTDLTEPPESPTDPFIVFLERKAGSFGLNVTGGVTTSVKDGGIYVKSVIPDSAADEEGSITKGDRILEVDGVSLAGLTHKQAVEALCRAPPFCKLLIQHGHVSCPPSSSTESERSLTPIERITATNVQANMYMPVSPDVERIQEELRHVPVAQSPTEGVAVLEMSLGSTGMFESAEREVFESMANEHETSLELVDDQGHGTTQIVTEANTFQVQLKKGSRGLGLSVVCDLDHGISRVKRVFPVGPAADSGQIQAGDILVKVNGKDLVGLSHVETMATLRGAGRVVKLVLCRPDPNILPSMADLDGSESLEVTPASSTSNISQSQSSDSDSDDDITPRQETLITPPTGFAPTPYPTDDNGHILPKVVSPPPALPKSPPPTLLATRSEYDSPTDMLNVQVGVSSLLDSCQSEMAFINNAAQTNAQQRDTTPVVRLDSAISDESREVTPHTFQSTGDITPINIGDYEPEGTGEFGDPDSESGLNKESVSSSSDVSHSSKSSVLRYPQYTHIDTADHGPSSVYNEAELSDSHSDSSIASDTEQSTSFSVCRPVFDKLTQEDDIQSLPESEQFVASLPDTYTLESTGEFSHDVNRNDAICKHSDTVEDGDVNIYVNDSVTYDDGDSDVDDSLKRLEAKYKEIDEVDNQSESGESTTSTDGSSVRDTVSPTMEDLPLQTGELDVTLTKPAGRGLGFTVVGGANTTGGCCIKAVLQAPALSDGRLKAGDMLIMVNGIDMRSLNHFDAVTVLRQAEGDVTIRVHQQCRQGPKGATDLDSIAEGAEGVSDVTTSHRGMGSSGVQGEVETDEEEEPESGAEEENDEPASESDSDASSRGDALSYSDGEPADGSEDGHSTTSTEGTSHIQDLIRSLEAANTGPPHAQGSGGELGKGGPPREVKFPSPKSPTSPETTVRHIELEKPPTGGLGISLVTAQTDTRTGVFVRTVTPGGVAALDGRLHVGDKILQINGESLVGLNHNKAANLLRHSEGTVTLTVSRGRKPVGLDVDWQGDKNESASSGQCDMEDEGLSSGSEVESDAEVKGERSEEEYESDFVGEESRSEDEDEQDSSLSLTKHVPTDIVDDDVDGLFAEAERILQAVDDAASLDEDSDSHSVTDTGATEPTGAHQYLPYAETIDLQPNEIEDESASALNSSFTEIYHKEAKSDDDQHSVSSSESKTECNVDLGCHDSDGQKSEDDRCWCESLRKLNVDIPDEVTSDWLNLLSLVTIPEETKPSIPNIIADMQDKIEADDPLEEFKQLRTVKPTDACSAANLVYNRCKNRFRNVLPYDVNRVRLSDDSTTDYVNASHVRVSVCDRVCDYISCQGPLPDTADDFWFMVWQQAVTVVVMLTRDMEARKVKCHRYWPDSVDTPIDVMHGRFRLSLLYLNSLDDLDIRNILMEDTATGASRCLYHLNYTTWPDHGVPHSAVPLLQCMRLSHELRSAGPLVVHCSAGIGRSGTFITIDTALAHIELGEKFSIMDIVTELRKQRLGMIQTRDQYLFCYTACVESLLNTR